MQLPTFAQPIVTYLTQPVALIRNYDRANLRPDLIAGITVAVILIPQGIAFSLIAELPPEMGLYASIVAAIVGGLWGSSDQMHTGPANAISLLILSALGVVADRPPAQILLAAGVMAVMVGVFQLLLGLARLGVLVNFVSHSVVVGFASGAGVLIAVKQLEPFFGLNLQDRHLLDTLWQLLINLPNSHLPTLAMGGTAVATVLLIGRLRPGLPGALIAMIVTTAAVMLFDLDTQGVAVIGELPRSLPPLVRLPLFDIDLINRLSVGALSVAAIGLVQTAAIARSFAAQTGQRLDNNQEFVGQGLSNIAAGFFSGYAGAGSFSRSVVNFKAGAATRMASVYSALFALVIMLVVAPLAAFLPISALSGVLILTAYGMIDRAEIVRIWRGARYDAVIMLVTLFGTLFLAIEFAVLLGILFSFAFFIMKSSVPQVQTMVPDDDYRHFVDGATRPNCPQLAIINISGDLYFGAVSHIEDAIMAQLERHPQQRFFLLRMHQVNQADFSGIHMLESVLRACRMRGGDLYMVRVSPSVRLLMTATGFDQQLGADNFLDEDEAIATLFYRRLDPVVCIYECPVRVFKECRNLPKRSFALELPIGPATGSQHASITPRALWEALHATPAPRIIDVREPREFRSGHVPGAQLVPLSDLLLDPQILLPEHDRPLVLVCRSGRRSQRAADILAQHGHRELQTLAGGMQAWEAAALLEAVDTLATGGEVINRPRETNKE